MQENTEVRTMYLYFSLLTTRNISIFAP